MGEIENGAATVPVVEIIGARKGTDIGGTVGRYAILGCAGEGSMGRVLRAYDPKLQREVALKVLAGHAFDGAARDRMQQEARAMAQLSHPNVVAVYDAEVVDGSMVIVMEYVAGSTLRQWLRSTERDWSEVVSRFVEAGRGLAAAHAKDLLHRDFKPSNVLVSVTGRVQVADFGLAAHATSLDTTAPIEVGSRIESPVGRNDRTDAQAIAGTPRYMAPEQHDGHALGAATDQYAFCVALWEALCGAPPFDGKSLSELGVLKYKGPPAWPSSVARIPKAISDALGRGLAVEAGERWPSMAALLLELSFDSYARRRRLLSLGGAAVVVVLGGTTTHLWLDRDGDRCEGSREQLAGVWDDTRRREIEASFLSIDVPYAAPAWARAEPELKAYADDWAIMHRETCEATRRGEQSAELLDRRMACLDQARVGFGAAMSVLADADQRVVARAHLVIDRLRPLSRCADTKALLAEVEPPLATDRVAVEQARASLAEAAAQRSAGRYERAQRLATQAERGLMSTDYGPAQTELARERGDLLERQGLYEESEAQLRQALALGLRWGQWNEVQVAASRLMLVVGDRQRRGDVGLQFRELAQELSRGRPRAEANMRTNLASIYREQGRYDEAELEYRRALDLLTTARGADHPVVAIARNNLALALRARGKLEEAAEVQREALAKLEAALGPHHPHVGALISNLANAQQERGLYAEAEVLHRRGLALRRRGLGPEHPDVAQSLNNLANVLKAQGRYEEAEREHRAAGKLLAEILGPEHHHVGISRHNLANVLAKQGRYTEAEREHRAVNEILEQALGPDHPHRALSWDSLGGVLAAQGQLESAEVEFRRALALRLDKLGDDHPDVAETRSHLADLLLARGEASAALPLGQQAWRRRQRDDTPREEQADTAFVLARTQRLTATSAFEHAQARTLAERARDLYRDAGSHHAAELAEVESWLSVSTASPDPSG